MASVGAAARLAEVRAILGGERDSMRAVWDNSASEKDRRVLLLMGGCSNGFEQAHFSGRSWCDLEPDLRSRIRCGLGRFRKWAALLEDGEVLP